MSRRPQHKPPPWRFERRAAIVACLSTRRPDAADGGCGRIGAPVLAACQAGQLPGWQVCSVLVRRAEAGSGPLFTTNLGDILATRPDLVVEVAGPAAPATVGEQVLLYVELWTTSAATLADEPLLRRLEAAGRESGHRGTRRASGGMQCDRRAAAGDAGRPEWVSVRGA